MGPAERGGGRQEGLGEEASVPRARGLGLGPSCPPTLPCASPASLVLPAFPFHFSEPPRLESGVLSTGGEQVMEMPPWTGTVSGSPHTETASIHTA